MHSNFAITQANTTTLQIVAGVDNAQVCVGINGRWRYNSATVNAAHPGGAAGTYDIYVTASDNSYAPSGLPAGQPPEIDNTIYTFGLVIRVGGSPPATALWRKVGTCVWDGAQITDFTVTVGWSRHHVQHEPGGSDPINISSFGIVLHATGTLAARPAAATTNRGYVYFATDSAGGTLYVNFSGAAWTAVTVGLTAAPNAHAASHLAGGTDALAWTTIHGVGTFAARPAAGSTNAGYIYLATDVFGGTLYRSDGATWAQLAPGVSQAGYGAGIILDFAGYEEDIPVNTTTTDGHQVAQVGAGAALYAKLTHGGTRTNKWDTFGGLPAPAGGNFRVPDLRGRGTIGTNVMGVANGTGPPTLTGAAVARAAANAIGVLVGEEFHTLTVAEVPALGSVTTGTESAGHTHSGTTGNDSPDHAHTFDSQSGGPTSGNAGPNWFDGSSTTAGASARHTHTFTSGTESVTHTHSVTLPGGGGSHENVFPVATVVKIITLQ